MRATYRLFAIIGAATAAAYFGLVFASVALLQKPGLPSLVRVPLQAVMVLTPLGVAAWWIFKKLQPNYSARTARKGAMAFAVFTPVSWGVAFPWMAGGAVAGATSKTVWGVVAGALGGLIGNVGESVSYKIQAISANETAMFGCSGSQWTPGFVVP